MSLRAFILHPVSHSGLWLLATVLLAAAVLQGCTQLLPALPVNVQGEMVQLTDHTPSADDESVYDPARKTAALFSAVNETVSLQLLVGGGNAGGRVSVSMSELAGPGGARIQSPCIKGFRMLPVQVNEFPPWYLRLVESMPEPAKFYDPLVPLDAPVGGQPFAIDANDRLAVWFDIYVPRGTSPGLYKGTISVQADRRQTTEIPVELKVYGFVLPDQRPIPALGGTDFTKLCETFVRRDGKPFVPANLDRNNPSVMQGLVVLRQLMTLAHEHRLDLFDRTLHPPIGRDMAGEVRLDWEDYVAIVKPYIDGTAFTDRIGVAAWPMPSSDAWPIAENYGGRSTEEYRATAGAVIAQSRAKLCEELGYGKVMFHWPYRQEVSTRAYGEALEQFALVRRFDADSAIVSTLPARVPVQTLLAVPPEMASVPAVLAPPGQWFDPAAIKFTDAPVGVLSGSWLAPGTPPYVPSLGIIATPSDVRALPWMAMKYQCSALFLSDVMHWDGDVYATPAGAETRLFYPGTRAGIEGVLPSVRLKRLRRGLTDLAYLQLLTQRGKGADARDVINALVRYGGLEASGDHYLDPRLGGWVHDGRQWEIARRLLAEEIQADIHSDEFTRHDLLVQQIAWQRFLDLTQTVRLEQARCTMSVTNGGQLRATVRLEVYNEFSRDVTLTAILDNLPKGWHAQAGEVRVSPLPPGAKREVILTAQSSQMPQTADGKLPMQVILAVNEQSPRTFDLAVPFVQAPNIKEPPSIDGKLADWPMRGWNSGANFRLLGARGQGPTPMAKRQTAAFVTHDDNNLYVALRCDEPNPAGLVARSNNIIHYEQLMACGEDLVELILDPGMKAQAPEDLYHLIVKPNGVLLAEKGIHTDPPLGLAGPWPVAAQVAVSREGKVWIVELAIPLEAFGPAGKERLWGINFARFSYQGQESSSWSGAPRYYYAPQNLGTMWMK